MLVQCDRATFKGQTLSISKPNGLNISPYSSHTHTHTLVKPSREDTADVTVMVCCMFDDNK